MSKVYVITGTRKGIGKDLCEHYLSNGHLVYGCSRRASSIENDNYTHFRVDVSNEAAVVKMIRTIYKNHKKIDVLINNAGIASMNHFLLTPYSTTKKIFETNFYGTFLFCREIGKIMSRSKAGRIINYSTVAVPLQLEGELIYASSKAAVVELTTILSKELGQYNITVNAIGPTPIQTDLIKNVPKGKIQELVDKQVIKRLGAFEDIVNVVDFFISDKSNFITGQIIYLGGIN